MHDANGMSIDRKDRLWVVDGTYYPKRVTCWGVDGTFQKEFLGNTQYGGGGVLDPQDKRRLFYNNMEFAIDWETGRSRLRNMTWLGRLESRRGADPSGRTDLPGHADGRHVDDPRRRLPLRERPRRWRPWTWPATFSSIRSGRPRSSSEAVDLNDKKFLWYDRNGDGEVQADEVTLSPRPQGYDGVTDFNDDLSVQAGISVTRSASSFPAGAGLRREGIPRLEGRCSTAGQRQLLPPGRRRQPDRVVDPAGQTLWSWPHEGWGGDASHHAKPYRPDQVMSELGIVGHAVASPGLGQLLVCTRTPGDGTCGPATAS